MYQVLEQFSDNLIFFKLHFAGGKINPVEIEKLLEEFYITSEYLREIKEGGKIDWIFFELVSNFELSVKELLGEIIDREEEEELTMEEEKIFDLFLEYLSKKNKGDLENRLETYEGIGKEMFTYKITKINIYLFLTLFVVFFLFGVNKERIFSKKRVFVKGQNSFFQFIYNLIKEQTGIEGIVHTPLIASTFLFIIINNLIGLLPFGYALTSHLMVTFFLGFSIFLGITFLIVVKKKEQMIELFLPKGVPAPLVPFLFVIEIISYVFRTISLSVRLFANMMAGHALLHILSNFGVVIFGLKTPSRFFFLFPLLIVFAITFLEFGIAILQAYVFAVLLTIYLNDVYAKGGH